MKRHEYREAMIWEELKEEDFAIAAKPDLSLLSKLINELRGEKTLERYANECNISLCVFYNILNGKRKRNILYRQLLYMYAHRDPKSKVKMEHLVAANGMLLDTHLFNARQEKNALIEEVKALPVSMNVSKKTKISASSEKYDTMTNEIDITFQQFLEDLSYYAYGHSEKELKKLHRLQHKLFEDKTLVKMLHLYQLKDKLEWNERVSAIKEFCVSAKRLRLPSQISGDMRITIDNYIFDTSN